MKKIIQLIREYREYYILYTAFGPLQRKWLLFLKNNPDVCFKNTLGVKDPDARLGYKACCLGQAGLMLGTCEWDKEKGRLKDKNSPSYDYPQSSYHLLGLRDMRGECYKIGLYSLSGLNDTHGWLAVYNTCINNPKAYFIKKV